MYFLEGIYVFRIAHEIGADLWYAFRAGMMECEAVTKKGRAVMKNLY
jgi:hypothetical protein